MPLEIGGSPVIYSLFVNSQTFEQREKWNRHFSTIKAVLGDNASTDECQHVLDKIIERAEAKNVFCLGHFEHWLIDSKYWKPIHDAIGDAIDAYIMDSLPKVVPHHKNSSGENVITIKDGDKTITKTFQRNGWVRLNIEHEDGTIEELYER